MTFGGLNPPEHSPQRLWKTLRLHKPTSPIGSKIITGCIRSFLSLSINFTWWSIRRRPWCTKRSTEIQWQILVAAQCLHSTIYSNSFLKKHFLEHVRSPSVHKCGSPNLKRSVDMARRGKRARGIDMILNNMQSCMKYQSINPELSFWNYLKLDV